MNSLDQRKKMKTDLKNGMMQQLHFHTLLNKVIEEWSCIKIDINKRKGKTWDRTIDRWCPRIHWMCARSFVEQVYRALRQLIYGAMIISVYNAKSLYKKKSFDFLLCKRVKKLNLKKTKVLFSKRNLWLNSCQYILIQYSIIQYILVLIMKIIYHIVIALRNNKNVLIFG